MRTHFMMFSHGASWNIEFAPLFIFSPISHRCALCLPIDLITKVDFNWIAGKAHKVRTEVIKKKLGWTKRGRQKRWKRRIAGWKRSIAANSQLAGTTFQTNAICPRKKSLISVNYFKATEQRIGGIFLPSKYFLPARKDIAEMVATTTQGSVRRLHGESCWYLKLRLFLLAWFGRSQSSKTGNSAG